MKRIIFILLCSFFLHYIDAQEIIIEGSVSYLSSSNIYTSFLSTERINELDSLYIRKDSIYSLLGTVKSKSSISVICHRMLGTIIKVGDKIYIKKNILPQKGISIEIPESSIKKEDIIVSNEVKNKDININSAQRKFNYTGRFSATTNSSISDKADYQRIRLSFNSTFNNIKGSRFSFNNYITFRHRYGVDQTKVGFYDDFKIYSLALDYKLNNNIQFTFGRQINNKISNIGAIDGLQIDGKKGEFIYGAFGGSRPDHTNYTFDLNLKQGGIYVGHDNSIGKGSMQTTLAFAEQRNHGKTDRRFAYLQHNFSGIKNISIFGSIEMDMYQKINDTIGHKLNLTSSYFSLRYRPFKKFTISTSYDNRRNIIFYETNRLYIDQLLNQETRQGWRLMAQYQVINNINISGSAFYRYQESAENSTKNYVANIHINRLFSSPLLLNINYNLITTSHFKGNIWGGRANYDLMQGKIQLELNYRKVKYLFNFDDQNLNQNIYGSSVSVQIRKMTTLMLNYEGTTDKTSTYHRYFITAMQRFRKK